MWLIDLWRWRVSRRRVAAEARRLLDEHGIRAFFRAHENAWSAQGAGRNREARFHRAVCYAISRHLQRRAVLEAVFAPRHLPGIATDHTSEGAWRDGRSAVDAEAMKVVHAQLLRDFA